MPDSASPSHKPAVLPTLKLLEPLPAGVEAADAPVIPLKKRIMLAGSRKSAGLLLPSSTVSRAHTLFVRVDGRVLVRDLVSREGTLVAGDRVVERFLDDGDEIQIGRFRFEFRQGEADDEPLVRTPATLTATSTSGRVQQVEVPTEQSVILVGRRTGTDLPLSGDDISTAHVALVRLAGFGGDGWAAFHLGGKPTFLNGQRIASSVVSNTDALRVGRFELNLIAEAPPAVELDDSGDFAALTPDESDAADTIESDTAVEEADDSMADLRRSWQSEPTDDADVDLPADAVQEPATDEAVAEPEEIQAVEAEPEPEDDLVEVGIEPAAEEAPAPDAAVQVEESPEATLDGDEEPIDVAAEDPVEASVPPAAEAGSIEEIDEPEAIAEEEPGDVAQEPTGTGSDDQDVAGAAEIELLDESLEDAEEEPVDKAVDEDTASPADEEAAPDSTKEPAVAEAEAFDLIDDNEEEAAEDDLGIDLSAIGFEERASGDADEPVAEEAADVVSEGSEPEVDEEPEPAVEDEPEAVVEEVVDPEPEPVVEIEPTRRRKGRRRSKAAKAADKPIAEPAAEVDPEDERLAAAFLAPVEPEPQLEPEPVADGETVEDEPDPPEPEDTLATDTPAGGKGSTDVVQPLQSWKAAPGIHLTPSAPLGRSGVILPKPQPTPAEEVAGPDTPPPPAEQPADKVFDLSPQPEDDETLPDTPVDGNKPDPKPRTVGFGGGEPVVDLDELDDELGLGPFDNSRHHRNGYASDATLDPSEVIPETSGLVGDYADLLAADDSRPSPDVVDRPEQADHEPDATSQAADPGEFLRVIQGGVESGGTATAVEESIETATVAPQRPARRRPRVPPPPGARKNVAVAEVAPAKAKTGRVIAALVGMLALMVAGVVGVQFLAAPEATVTVQIRHDVSPSLSPAKWAIDEQQRKLLPNDPILRREAAGILARTSPDVGPGWLADPGDRDTSALFVPEENTLVLQRTTKQPQAGIARLRALAAAYAARDASVRDEATLLDERARRRDGERLTNRSQADAYEQQLQALVAEQANAAPTVPGLADQRRAEEAELRAQAARLMTSVRENEVQLQQIRQQSFDETATGDIDSEVTALRSRLRDLEQQVSNAAPGEVGRLDLEISNVRRQIENREAELQGQRRREIGDLESLISAQRRSADRAVTRADLAAEEALAATRLEAEAERRAEEIERLRTEVERLDQQSKELRQADAIDQERRQQLIFAETPSEPSAISEPDERTRLMLYALLSAFTLGLVGFYFALRS
jgi:pSer/pThr/pTyr-binding forkhead associated (FHA) protein